MEIVEIRSAAHQEQAVALLNEGFPDAGFDWSLAFEAPPGKFGHGLLLIIDGEPQGELLCFEKNETLEGRKRRIVNVSSWYVREEYRRYLIWMVRHLTEDSETVFTACTPSRAVSKIGDKVGFRQVSEGSIASIPFLNGIRRRRGVEVRPFEKGFFDSETERWILEHESDRTIALTLHSEDRVAPLVLVRGLDVFQFPAVRLLFAGDFELLKQALPSLHSMLARNYGILGIYLPRIPELHQLRSIRRSGSGPSIIAKGEIKDKDVNLLFSELHFLPVTRGSITRKTKRALKRWFRFSAD